MLVSAKDSALAVQWYRPTNRPFQIVPPGVEPGLSAPKADVIAITP